MYHHHQLLHPGAVSRPGEIDWRDTHVGQGGASGDAARATAPSSGSGSIVSWMVVEPAPNDQHAALMPATIAIVELDDGRRIHVSVEGEVLVRTGQPVRVLFHPAIQGSRFPVRGVIGSAAGGCRQWKPPTHQPLPPPPPPPPPPNHHTHTAGDILEWFMRRRGRTTRTHATEAGWSR
ncbi:OB-fold domain-containing protein [Rhodococcus maanshanensis]|uniref:DUF35 OB-fold domain-containing protein, acyl-CoA-associated n=1 Tax=Rhodococcus maanshanensis TaxID=183556 RepID=A0A1H7LMR1_9NOCA|nr:OB-fold domain-containing protein [Rhodococcus maanshanensis]SEL00292.1 DUF35 OB-fold domain-containing protein, acyl-CoA-associated [Rhodococcus maanshanensis]